jgi:hypothetical protein
MFGASFDITKVPNDGYFIDIGAPRQSVDG